MSKFRCTECFRPNSIPHEDEGHNVNCSHCNSIIHIPRPTYKNGTNIEGFLIVEWLGNGSLGEIYKAKQTSINHRIVALKIVTNEHIHCKKDMERFIREIKTVANLNHKNIATAFIAGQFEDGAYLASNYIEGATLDDMLQKGPIPEANAIQFSTGIAEALKYAWEVHQTLHRDLKPTNFMVDKNDHIYLVDMCVAKSLEILGDLTVPGMAIGTPYYISPEQTRAEEDLDNRTDVYGLGATFYQMVTGLPPYFDSGNHLEVAAKKLKEPPKNPKDINPEISDETNALILELMSIDKKDRPQTWDEVIEKLENLNYEEIKSEDKKPWWRFGM